MLFSPANEVSCGDGTVAIVSDTSVPEGTMVIASRKTLYLALLDGTVTISTNVAALDGNIPTVMGNMQSPRIMFPLTNKPYYLKLSGRIGNAPRWWQWQRLAAQVRVSPGKPTI